MQIGNKTSHEWIRLIKDPASYQAFLRMFLVHGHPLLALYDQCFSGRCYPLRYCMRTPIGPIDITLFHVADMSTLNLVFSRQDYLCPADAKVVVDIGSNIGISAAFFLTRNRGAFAYLFEPNPNVLPRLRENMRTFQGRYELHETAIADSDGKVNFALEETGRNGMIAEQGPDTVVVDAQHVNTALASIVCRHGMIDCLKIDVESMEERILCALDPELWQRIRLLNVEAKERFACIPDYFKGDVCGSAYRLWNTRVSDQQRRLVRRGVGTQALARFTGSTNHNGARVVSIRLRPFALAR